MVDRHANRLKHTKTNRQGFTIVELLIVIVVIGILAAITIVAYNGVQNRANAAAAQSATSQSTKKVLAYAIENGDSYPTTLAIAGVNVTGSTSYQYSVNNTASPKTYCITATVSTVSYFSSHTTATPTIGACPGHGSGGVAAVTNLAPRPIASSSWAGGYGTGGAGTSAVVTDTRFPGAIAYQLTWSTPPTSGSNLFIHGASSTPCVVGQTYYISVRYAASWSGMIPGYYLSGPNVGTPSTSVDRGDGTREVRGYYTATAGCSTNFLPMISVGSGTMYPGVNATLLVGGYMIVAASSGETFTYGDGSSPGWVWNGTTNGSSSTGPAL